MEDQKEYGLQAITPAPLTPQEQVDKASEMAKVLQGIVKQAGLAKNFGGKKDHLEYEAWQTIAQFFQCSPITEWTKSIRADDGEIVGWEARVVVHNATGRVIASAENMCMRDEPNWKNKPNYALRSMAQTRAAGKALRSVFAFVAVLAGYSATPSEEMISEFESEKEIKSKPSQKSIPKPLSEAQRKKMYAMSANSELNKEEVADFLLWFKKEKAEIIKVDDKETITAKSASDFFDNFDSYLSEFSVSVLGVVDPPQEDMPMFEDKDDISY